MNYKIIEERIEYVTKSKIIFRSKEFKQRIVYRSGISNKKNRIRKNYCVLLSNGYCFIITNENWHRVINDAVIKQINKEYRNYIEKRK